MEERNHLRSGGQEEIVLRSEREGSDYAKRFLRVVVQRYRSGESEVSDELCTSLPKTRVLGRCNKAILVDTRGTTI